MALVKAQNLLSSAKNLSEEDRVDAATIKVSRRSSLLISA